MTINCLQTFLDFYACDIIILRNLELCFYLRVTFPPNYRKRLKIHIRGRCLPSDCFDAMHSLSFRQVVHFSKGSCKCINLLWRNCQLPFKMVQYLHLNSHKIILCNFLCPLKKTFSSANTHLVMRVCLKW